MEARGRLRREARAVPEEVSRSFFDTNVLLYLFDNAAPEKKARAQDILEIGAG